MRERSSSQVYRWFYETYGKPTPAQAAAWPHIEAGRNVLIVSPTGTGKTLAAFLAVVNALAELHDSKKLRRSIYAIYISPLRALSYDLEKNLRGPLEAIYGKEPPIKVGLRSGDTSSYQRQQQLASPPHILLTTPESLSILLTQPRWTEALSTVRWIILDEVHALAENKRGAHLTISLERLEELGERARREKSETPSALQRIGLSATVAPLHEVSRFLVGTDRACELLDVSAAKKIDLKVYSPLHKNPYPEYGYTGQRLIKELAKLITENRTTLIFSNTRSGAEAATYWLHKELPELSEQIECHHASLDRDVRQEVEDRLKRGELRAAVCSTSLELGIDIGSVDLVVMLSTPKGVSRALQRTGRAGHNINSVSRGLVVATNMNDLVECCATVLLARSRQLDPVRIPQKPLDVLAQHLASMGCGREWARDEAFELIHRAYPYKDLTRAEFDEALDFLAGGGESLRKQYTETFGKIHLTETTFVTREGRIRRDILQNVGVIPNEGMIAVKLRARTLGLVEEIFLRQLQVGDVFIIAGRPVKLERVGTMECFVTRADHALPTVPRWNASKMPLTNKVAEEIIGFRSELRARFESVGSSCEHNVDWISERLECGKTNAAIICKMYAAQSAVSEIPTADFLLVEELLEGATDWAEGVGQQKPRTRRRFMPARTHARARHYFFHCLIGRGGNEALSRVVALRLSRLRGGNAIATPDDYGFVLTVTPGQVFTADELPELLSPRNFAEDLHTALSRSELMKYHFRNAAQTGLMVYRNILGEQKTLRKLQWSSEVLFNVLQEHEPNHILMREARRDAVHVYIDLETAQRWVEQMQTRPVRLRPVDHVPPLSFALFATKIKEALLVEDPREMTERLYHLWWEKIEANEKAGLNTEGQREKDSAEK
ncbi:MAG TPA: DEAD/DEAH box helicase [Methylomirabilota bacterium]|nr:DEAD/DEAH box helicase [Methylomirabilota bacterium]